MICFGQIHNSLVLDCLLLFVMSTLATPGRGRGRGRSPSQSATGHVASHASQLALSSSTTQATPDAFTSGTTDTEHSSTASFPPAVSAVSLKLPPFWPGDPELWFAQVEAQFDLRGITAQTTKFSYVMASLTQEFAHKVRDVLLHPPADEPFIHLKRQLITRLCASEQKRIRQLLSEEQLGDRTPSQFLRHLQQLQGSTTVESALLQELFLQRLPSQVRMVLASTPDLPLERQALLADNLIEIASSPSVNSVRTAATPTLPASDALAELRAEVCALREQLRSSQHRGRSPSPGRRGRSRSSTRSEHEDGLCWYHQHYGTNARHCTPPCEMSGNRNASR